MKIILILIILVTACVSVVSSWVGVLAYYTLALWGPQYIWFWLFADLRVSFVVAVFTFLGVGVGFFKTGYEFRFLFTRINFWVLILYVSILVSYLFGPYIDNPLNKQFDPDTFIFDATKIFLFYFIATLAINDIEKLKYFTLLFVAVIVYYCYWANKQYFTDNWSQFAVGRLMGPFGLDMGSIYRDENSFAMLFVSGLPFLYSFSLKTGKMIRFTCWAVILLGWHAIFLTGSRGGVVGLSVIIFAIIFW
ncbi:MAG: hypothetical protein KKF12_17195, partial [Proteobacteria bacterium]|nr:hypothetical protein [Desulfobacula sp.]MBU4132554.1 hypothetical protein [Pseudomonadota bacterium]